MNSMNDKQLLKLLELKLMGYTTKIRDLEQEIQRLKNEKRIDNKSNTS
jgi:hypothetical protein